MKRKQFVISTIIALLLALFAGCKQSFSPTLQKADQVLSTDTEKGSKMLDSICQAEPNMSTADKKYYQLLKLKASDKDYQPITNQKLLIDSLVSYFEHAGEDNLLAEAYFYAGRVYYEIGDKPEALKFYQKASEKVAKDNYALQGDIYCQMANVYRYTDLNKEALAALRLAYQADSLSGNIRNVLYDIRDIGEIYQENNDFSKAKTLFCKGLKLAEMNKDTLFTQFFHHELSILYYRTNNLAVAKYHIEICLNNIRKINYDKSGLFVTALRIYTKTNNMLLAKKYRMLILKNGHIFAKQYALENKITSQLATAKDSQLDIDFKQYKIFSDSISKLRDTESIKKVESLYNYKIKENENTILRKENLIKNIIILVTICFISILSICIYMRIKNMKQEQELLKLKIDKLNNLKEVSKKKAISNHSREQDLKDRSSAYNALKKEIQNGTFKLSDDIWQQLSSLVNTIYPNFDKDLESFLKVSQQEYKICLLIKLGISPSNMAKILNVTKEAITASRRRMYNKVFKTKGSPQDWDKLILSL